jgi:transcriptional/translational regulatory protein YebC/TACO1
MKYIRLDVESRAMHSLLTPSLSLTQAAKRGGVDPQKNLELTRVLKEAHSVHLPKENIERATRKASDSSNAEDFKHGTYEVFGHGET